MFGNFILLICLSILQHSVATPKPKCKANSTSPPVHIEPFTLDPLTACHTVDRKFGFPHESARVSLAGFLGRSYDPLIDKSYFPILEESFKNCLRTPDSRFNIPDNYLAELIMEREVDSDAQLSTTFKEAVKDTSAGGSASGSGDGEDGTGAASGNANYQSTKKKMEKGDQAMFHLKVKNTMYRLTGDLSAPFSAHYADRLEPIIAAIDSGHLRKARYLTQRLLADYGTHITMEATVGTLLEYRAYVASSTVTADESVKTAVAAEATVALKEAGTSGQGAHGQNSQKQKQKSTFDMSVEAWTMGGAELRKVISTNPADVLDDSHPVALAWKIYPIYMMLEGGNVNASLDTTRQLRDLFEEATNEYLERNLIRGCMNPRFFNFDFQANVDDGTCRGNFCTTKPLPGHCSDLNGNSVNKTGAYEQRKRMKLFHECVTTHRLKLVKKDGRIISKVCGINARPANNPIAGGIFQTCEPHPTSKRIEAELAKLGKKSEPPCDGYHITNFVTNKMACPEGQVDVVIARYQHLLPEQKIALKQSRCTSPINCTLVWTTIVLREQIKLTAHWCEYPNSTRFTSLRFGGYFDRKQINNFNALYVCPQWATEVRLGRTTSLCLSHPSADPYTAELTLLFSSHNPDGVCRKGHSLQLITVLEGTKLYACLLKKHAYVALDSPAVIGGAFLDSNAFRSSAGRSQLIIRTEKDVRRVFFEDINNNLYTYLADFMAMLVKDIPVDDDEVEEQDEDQPHAMILLFDKHLHTMLYTVIVTFFILCIMLFLKIRRRRIKQHTA